MRITLIHLGIDGAGPLYSIEMAVEMVRQGYDLLAIVSRYTDNIGRWRELAQYNPNVTLLEINGFTSKKDLIPKTLALKPFFQIRKAIRNHRSEVLYAPMTDLWQPLVFKFFVPRGVLRVKTVHDMNPHPGENGRLLRWYHSFVFRNTDKIVTLSSVFVPQLEARGFAPKDIVVVPHANFSHYNPNRQKPGANPGEPKYNVLFFGRILRYKGLEVLLEAMPAAVEAHPKLRLVIAGGGDITPYTQQIEALGSHVELHNRRIEDQEIASFFERCGLVALPYTEASQSGVIPTAFSFAKPVVATRLGGIPEQLSSGGGVLVEPNDVQGLAQAIVALYNDPQRLEQLSEQAWTIAQTEMSWEASVDKLIKGIKR